MEVFDYKAHKKSKMKRLVAKHYDLDESDLDDVHILEIAKLAKPLMEERKEHKREFAQRHIEAVAD